MILQTAKLTYATHADMYAKVNNKEEATPQKNTEAKSSLASKNTEVSISTEAKEKLAQEQKKELGKKIAEAYQDKKTESDEESESNEDQLDKLIKKVKKDISTLR